MNTLIDKIHEPAIRYGLYTQTLAPIVMDLAFKIEDTKAEIVSINSEEELSEAVTIWSAQLEEGFIQQEAKRPEFARRKDLPDLYTVENLRKTLGATAHVLMKVTAPTEQQIISLTNEALQLAN